MSKLPAELPTSQSPVPLLRVSGLTKRYGEERAIDHVTFSANSGEVVGIIGPNGATTELPIVERSRKRSRRSASAVRRAGADRCTGMANDPGQHTMTKQIDARLAAPSWCWTCNERAVTWTKESGVVFHV